jgi:uncharacterized protein with GYD domain
MPTYIALANWTDQGARQIKESPHRVDLARKTLKEMGGEFRSLYMTMGDYDLVFVYEAPDDAVAARFHACARAIGHGAHAHAEGVSRGGLPGDHQLVAVIERRGGKTVTRRLHLLPG